MLKELQTYTREELENKLMHLINSAAFRLASEYIEQTEPMAKVIRTPEAEAEHIRRIGEFMILAIPVWDIIEKTHPGYDVMTDWVINKNKDKFNPCVCSGCKKNDEIVN